MNFYLVFSTVIFFFLSVVWKTSDVFNFILRIIFFILTGWGIFLELQYLGYIIHR